MSLDGLGAAHGGLDDFRIESKREVGEMLRRLMDGNTPLHLNASSGSVVNATLWSADPDRNTLGFAVDANDAALEGLLSSQEVVVVGYLDSVKVQFDAGHLVLVHGANASVLTCSYPRELYRFQRRGAYRVRPLLRSAPVAKVRHTDIADMQLALRILDVSIGGCALFLPSDVPPMQVGGVLNQVVIELDPDTRFHVNMRLQHVTSIHSEARGVRLGCEFVRADSGALRTLQRFIDLTQKRGKLLSV